MKTLGLSLQLALEKTEFVGYLYDGTGDPWAGQDRLKVWPNFFVNIEPVCDDENFGVEPPTGSEDRKLKYLPI